MAMPPPIEFSQRPATSNFSSLQPAISNFSSLQEAIDAANVIRPSRGPRSIPPRREYAPVGGMPEGFAATPNAALGMMYNQIGLGDDRMYIYNQETGERRAVAREPVSAPQAPQAPQLMRAPQGLTPPPGFLSQLGRAPTQALQGPLEVGVVASN